MMLCDAMFGPKLVRTLSLRKEMSLDLATRGRSAHTEVDRATHVFACTLLLKEASWPRKLVQSTS
jgi:hypothetical protein